MLLIAILHTQFKNAVASQLGNLIYHLSKSIPTQSQIVPHCGHATCYNSGATMKIGEYKQKWGYYLRTVGKIYLQRLFLHFHRYTIQQTGIA